MQNSSDKISIVIVTYNAAATLQNAIESVLQQDYQNKELIIIDGKSSDGTVDILNSYSNSIACWISEKDNGIYAAMNKGIAAASGNWLLFLGADDMLCQNILSQIFLSKPAATTDIIYGKIKTLQAGKQAGAETVFEKIIANNIPHQAIFYNATVLKKFNGYNTRYKILADYELNYSIFEDSSLQTKFVDTVVAVFNSRGISNRTIDYPFFSEKLQYLVTSKGIKITDARLDKYFFFTGVALVLKKQRLAGLKNILHSIAYSKRKMYYLALSVDFLLSFIIKKRAYKYV